MRRAGKIPKRISHMVTRGPEYLAARKRKIAESFLKTLEKVKTEQDLKKAETS